MNVFLVSGIAKRVKLVATDRGERQGNAELANRAMIVFVEDDVDAERKALEEWVAVTPRKSGWTGHSVYLTALPDSQIVSLLMERFGLERMIEAMKNAASAHPTGAKMLLGEYIVDEEEAGKVLAGKVVTRFLGILADGC